MQNVERRTLTEAVTDALRGRLLAGEWPAGTHLRQESLAAELGVSRIPLREALQRLEAEGLVNLLPHRGATVASLDPADVIEIFELRAVLESDLTKRAVPALTAEDFRVMQQHADLFEQAVTGGALVNWGAANRDFHAALYARASRPRTCEVVGRLLTQVDRFVRLQMTLTHGMARAVKEHREILYAARSGDSERAAQIVQDHILSAGRGLSLALSEHRICEDPG